MIKSARGCALDDDVDDEEEFLLKKETPSPIRKGISIVYINKWTYNSSVASTNLKILLFENKNSFSLLLWPLELYVYGINDIFSLFFLW